MGTFSHCRAASILLLNALRPVLERVITTLFESRLHLPSGSALVLPQNSITTTLDIFATMPKRKAVQAPSLDDSDLSPPPNDPNEGAAALANANADLDSTTQPTKKRKTATSTVKSEAVTETTNGTVASTQKRTTRTRKVKPEPEEEEAASSAEEAPKPAPKKRQTKVKVVKKEEAEEEEELAKPLPKGRARKKAEVKEEEPFKEESNAKAVEKPVKKKRKTKEEKEAEAMPLSARTVGHKLFIGAHVSSAGGQSFHIQLYSTDISLYSSRSQDLHVQLTPLVQASKMHH